MSDPLGRPEQATVGRPASLGVLTHCMPIAHDPGVRLRDIATTLGITERSAYSIVTDLTASGYVVKLKDGRRNRYRIQSHLPLREAITQERTIGEVLDVLVESKIPRRGRRAPG